MDFLKAKGKVLSVEKESQTKAKLCHCPALPLPSRLHPRSMPSKFLDESKRADRGAEESSERQRRALGTRTLPALCILARGQNYKNACDYWLLSINDRHNYNDAKDRACGHQ